MRRAAGALLACALAVLAAGCAAPRAAPEAAMVDVEVAARDAWRARRAALAALDGWDLKGRIAAHAGRRGGSATLLWQRRGDRTTLQLHGPFGGGRVRISVAPGLAELVDARGRVTVGASAAEALRRRTGWQVPFAQLTRWVRGLPGDDATGIVVDARGRVKRFSEGDWRVEYAEYASVGDVELPRRLTLTALPARLAALRAERVEVGDRLQVRLVVTRWRGLDFADAGD